MIDVIKSGDVVIAIIVPHDFSASGVKFFTPDSFSQQLAYMHHPAGKVIPPHTHNHVAREIHYTQEVLVIKRGRLRADFYDEASQYLESRILGSGDVILLSAGGHGFEVLDELEMFEVKQGPYAGESDKSRFAPICANLVVYEREV